MNVCSLEYDSLSSQMEHAPCPTASGDPVLGQSTPTFANCPGTSALSSISAGYQAVNYSGKNVLTLPIWTGYDYYARLSNWSQGGSAPGFRQPSGSVSTVFRTISTGSTPTAPLRPYPEHSARAS